VIPLVAASETGEAQHRISSRAVSGMAKCGVRGRSACRASSPAGVQVRSKAAASLPVEGERPVGPARGAHERPFPVESGCLRVQPKVGGKLLLRLNMTTRPIANKYREGKLKRTLKRELKSA
jgi:hypothetical protein